MLDQRPPDSPDEKKAAVQRNRAKWAWLIGAPIGGLALGIMIPAIALSVAEQDFRDSVSTSAVESVLNDPAVTVTESVEKTVTVHPVETTPSTESTTPVPTPVPGTATGGKPDYGAPVRDYCRDMFPAAADKQAYSLCVKQTSGGTVDP